ncbi:GGDEF domain-containing protein [Stenotrophomonas mori]|uniref:diguanylate cyclase n=1 Tax=Stenotrophomonas mori TaxID=2871096 RepID=A0ABT0SEZ3_9GAMM|nr:GGDEF domain-containing protein [Stenotrophomonas mori]MCL7713873.1 GGDEF domain-containing protein [Stenotrophomonas mori]
MKPPAGPPTIPSLPRELRSVPLRTIAPVATLALLVFAGWLAWHGRTGWALAALACAAPAAAATWLSHRRAVRLSRAGLLLCLAHVAGCLLSAAILGASALPWSLLVLMVNFFLVPNRIATPANLAMVAGLLALPGVLRSPAPDLQALAVIGLILGFGFRFSRRMHGDRTRLELLASLDELTGLPNRRALEKTLTQQIVSTRQGRFRHALVILDIDHFKDVNDRYGHTAGDNALIELAAILRSELREQDKVFRFGGEEFVVLAEAGNRDALARFTERLRQSVQQSLHGPGGGITISLGAAMYAGEKYWQDWFSRADAALYLAKGSGRNSVVVADDLA